MQLKGLHESALEALLEARKKGHFRSPEDFLCRVDIDIADVKILVKSGAFDSIAHGASRPKMIWQALAWNENRASRRAVTRSLFHDLPQVVPPQVPQYSARTILEHELETLDFLISRHPLSLYVQPLSTVHYVKGSDLPKYAGTRVTTVGWWVTGKLITTKEDEPMEFISFEDTSALYETVFFPKAYARFCHILNRSRPYVLTGAVQEEFGVYTLAVDSVRLL
jgi:error-prone DNA polymerase